MGNADTISKLYLIRHGETVDNVKGLYAGVRDSVLTVHGVQQTRKLGAWLAENKPPLTHLFSSDLVRAVRTAEAIRAAQTSPQNLQVDQQPLLQEQNFGALEGQPWTSKQDGRPAKQKGNNSENEDVAETKEELAARALDFLTKFLHPQYSKEGATKQPAHVAVVSHGMMLSALWKQLLKQSKQHSITIEPELLARHQPLTFEHIGSWSNTGFMELELTPNIREHEAGDPLSRPKLEIAACIRILAINERTHLSGLKRTRGGIGSSAHDEQQKPITSFFKRPRTS